MTEEEITIQVSADNVNFFALPPWGVERPPIFLADKHRNNQLLIFEANTSTAVKPFAARFN